MTIQKKKSLPCMVCGSDVVVDVCTHRTYCQACREEKYKYNRKLRASHKYRHTIKGKIAKCNDERRNYRSGTRRFWKYYNGIKDNVSVSEKISQRVKESYASHPESVVQRVASRRATYMVTGYPHCGKMIYTNERGERFRSILEKNFADLLFQHSIEYRREQVIRMKDGRLKVVDFVVGDVLIEITGYAHQKWRDDFNNKIGILRESVTNQIMLLTYPANIPELDKIRDIDLYVGNIYDEKRILSTLTFCTELAQQQKNERNMRGFE